MDNDDVTMIGVDSLEAPTVDQEPMDGETVSRRCRFHKL